MSLPTKQYPPPGAWEEFECLCADLYERIWKDPSTQRHGRQGQPQGGVDIYGRPDGQHYTGVQCKKKDIWPTKELTTDEIDEEIEKAKTWDPGLKHFIIATTALNDDKVQAHARAVTERHEKKGLFSVTVASWNEITRRLGAYPELLRAYGYLLDLAQLSQEASTTIADETAKPVIQALGKTEVVSHPIFLRDGTEDEGLAEALERDLMGRYDRAMRRSFFPEAMATDEFVSVADVACEPPYAAVKTRLRRTIILRAVRSAAVRKSIQKAEELLTVAQTLAGEESDRIARARILEARGDVDGALVLIRDQKDLDSRSTLLNVLFRHRGADATLKAFSDRKLSVRDLTINGLQTVAAAYLQNEDFDGLRECFDELSSEQLGQGPYFRFLRAMVNVATLLPVPDRELAFRSFQMDARRGRHSVLDVAKTAARLDLAIGDLTALLPIAAELDLQQAQRLAGAYLRWCELLHPFRKDAGLEHLRSEMQDLVMAKERLALAFAFDPKFDPQPIHEYLDAREELGGLDDDDLKSALIIRIHADDPASVASLIAQYRARFEATYKDPPIFTIELQALALAGDTASAWLLLDKHRTELTPEGVVGFEALIKKSEGKDPVVEDLKVYEQTKSPEALRVLVSSLAGKKDHRAIAKYSEELYVQSTDPRDIARAAQAFGRLGDDIEFLRVIEAHPTLKEQEPGLLHYYAWALFRKGRLKEAKAAAEALSPTERDLQLEVIIAIESGEWESLAKPLAAYLDDASKYSGLALIRAAHIAQQSGHGPFMDLVKAAIAKAGDNPHVWLGAYTAILEAGLEEEVPESHEWFRRAMAHSGKKGPIQQFELKDLVPQQVEWNKRTAYISERVNKAEVPLVIAAPGLRTTVVDMLLRNLVRNSSLDDARRKYVIPLFSGHRPPERVGPAVSNLGLDISGLLVLGWLGLLPKVFSAFMTIALPATILTELFNGRERVQHVQKSRIKRARELEQAILRSRIKIVRPVENVGDPLSSEVGPSIAALIQSAAESGGVVLRPGPVHRPGLEQKIADVTSQLAYLADMHSLLKVLVEKGAVNQTEEEAAKGYFSFQDKGLPGCVEPDPLKPLFIEGLALVYLQGAGLLDAVLKVFKDVRIEGSSEDEALALIEHHQHVEEVLNIIDDIRNLIRAANASGKVQFGPRRNERGKRIEETPSTLHLLSDLTAVDAVVCDDRALNKENFAADSKGKRIPCLSTLDVLEELHGRGKLSDTERISARHRLRVGGAALVPVDLPEVSNALGRSHKAMSAEMRAIQESIDLARIAEIPIFPRELRWYASVSIGMKSSVIPIWKTVSDIALAGRLSNMVMHVIPKPEDWAACWDAGPPPGWVDGVNTVVTATLAVPIELDNMQVEVAYNDWFERHHLEPLRAVWPERYQAVVEQVRAFILDGKDTDETNPKKSQKVAKDRSQHKRRQKGLGAHTKSTAKTKASAKGKPRGKGGVKKTIDMPRLRALFALRKLERQLSSDVMSDGTVAKTFKFLTHRPANLGTRIEVHQDRLINAFRDALAGKAVKYIVDAEGKRLPAKVSISANGTAQIEIADKNFAFTYAGLLSADIGTRCGYLEQYLNERTLAGIYFDELRSLVGKAIISDDDFLAAVGILSDSPESFVQSIKAKVTSRDLSNVDLLPEGGRHWDNLVAPWKSALSLEEFLRGELAAERAKAFAENPVRAFFTASLSCCAPGLVPLDKLRELPADTILDIAGRASSLPDHFALTSAFELCADRLPDDARLDMAGTKLLDQLLGDMVQFKDRCTFFAAIFILTQARLAQHQHHRRKPAFWRRITSAANASLVTRACGTDNAESLFKWAVEHSGKSFVFSILLEEASEPRWKADWLSGNHLIADALGRIDAAVARLPEELRPSEWVFKIEKARAFIVEHHLELFAALPAIGESTRHPQPALEDTAGFREPFAKLCDQPTLANLIECTPGIYLLGAPKEVNAACHVLVEQLQNGPVRLADNETQFALQLLSFVCVLSQDESLADAIAEFAVQKVRELKDEESTFELLCRVIECSSAYNDRVKATKTLAKRLEAMAFLTKASVSVDLHDSIDHLRLVNENLSQSLGRALAATRLARRAA